MEDIQGNSHKSRDNKRPQVKPVVSSAPRRRRTPLGRRFADAFTGTDARSVGSFIIIDVFMPAVKEMVSDMVREGVDRWLFGEGRSHRGGRGRPGSGNFSYDRVSKGGTTIRRDEGRSPRRNKRSDVEDLIIDSRVEAEEVLRSMYEILGRYDLVTVAEVYDLLQITPDNTDFKWGWDSLEGARVQRARGGGYVLDLPSTKPIED